MSVGLLARLRGELSSRLAQNALWVLGFSGLGRAIAVGKEMLVAALFGVGGMLDAYVLAFLVPSVLVNILGAAFASALVPALGARDAAKNEPDAGARALLGRALCAQALVLAAFCLALALAPAEALRLVAPALPPERLALVKHLQTALLPVLFFGGLSQTLAAGVNYRGGFKGPAVATTLGAVATVGVIALAHGGLGVQALVAGVDAGAALEFALLAALAGRAWSARGAWRREPDATGNAANDTTSRTTGKAAAPAANNAPANDGTATEGARGQGPGQVLGQVLGPALRPALRGVLPGVLRGVLRDWSLLALGAAMLAASSFVDNAIATTLGEGAVSALNYAWKLPSGFATLIGLTLSTVLLPYFTGLAHNAPAGSMRRACRGVTARVLLVSAPLALAGALASPWLVELLFQRGRFDASAAGLVAQVQACYFVQLPFYLLSIATGRMLQALGRFRFLLLLQAGLVVLNALTSLALSRLMGVAGLALSSALMYALCALASLWAVRRGLEIAPRL